MIARQVALLQKRLERAEATIKRITQIETKPRLIVDGGGGGFNRIEFIVVSATTVADSGSPYNGMRKLVVTVKSPSCNAPGIWNTTVDVYEHQPACLTDDETDEALAGRKGWAYQGVHQDMSSGADPGDLTPCHYVLDGLCCPP